MDARISFEIKLNYLYLSNGTLSYRKLLQNKRWKLLFLCKEQNSINVFILARLQQNCNIVMVKITLCISLHFTEPQHQRLIGSSWRATASDFNAMLSLKDFHEKSFPSKNQTLKTQSVIFSRSNFIRSTNS